MERQEKIRKEKIKGEVNKENQKGKQRVRKRKITVKKKEKSVKRRKEGKECI